MPSPADKPSATSETDHLRTLLEKQPSCLMRVGVDGVWLAVNEAALGLLDESDLAKVLGRSISDRIADGQVGQWPEFAARVWSNGAGSFECSLLDRAGASRTIQLQAIALRDHHDGIESLLVAARDVSVPRELERTLQTSGAELATLNAVRAELEAALARERALAARVNEAEGERDRQAGLVQESEAARQKIEAFHLKERAPLQALAEQQQLALLEQDRRHRDVVKALRAELAQAAEEQRTLRTANETLLADQGRTLSDQQQLATLLEEDRRHREMIAALQAELAQAVEDQRALRATNEELVAGQGRILSEQQQLAAELEQERSYRGMVSGLRAELALAVEEQGALRTANEALIADQGRTQSEQQQLAAQLEEERRHREMVASLQAELAKAVEEQRELRASNEATLAEQARAFAEQQRIAQMDQERIRHEEVSRLQADLDRAAADHQALREANEGLIADQARTLSEQQQLALLDQDRRHRQAVERLEEQIAQMRAEQQASSAASEEAMAERTRAFAEQQAAFTEQSRERDELVRALRAQLADALAQQEMMRATYDALAAEQARQLAEQQRLAILEQGRVHRDTLASLQEQLAQVTTEHAELRAANEALAAEHARGLAEHAAGRAELERALATAHEHAAAQLLQRDQQLEEFQQQLTAVLADRDSLGSLVERADATRSELDAELARARADAYVVRQQLEELQKRHEQRHEEVARLQQRVAVAEQESRRVIELLEQQEVRIAELRAQITDGQADHRRLQMLLAESEAHQMRLTADYAAERLKTRREVADAIVEHDRVMKGLVDDNVELRHLRDSARGLESLAATGRLAREIGGELHDAIAQLNAQSTNLLTLTPLDAGHRAGVEAVRLGALRAAALARQLTQSETGHPSAASQGETDAVAGAHVK